MRELFHKIIHIVQQGQRVALATVISSKGSLPMSKRAKMLVFEDGTIMGTVGGGLLEAQVIEEAQQMLTTLTPKILAVDLTSEQIEADGLTCGGTVEIFIECFTPESDTASLQEIIRTCTESATAVVATLLPVNGFHQNKNTLTPYESSGRKLVIHADETVAGTLGHKSVDEHVVRVAGPRIGQSFLKTVTLELSEEEVQALRLSQQCPIRVFLESILPTPTAYLFGGGHVSLHLSKLLDFIGFEYVVIDDRQEFLTRERFPQAKAFVLHDFDNVFETLALIPHSSYLIIVTRGHKFDLTVLHQAMRADAKYVGMIGSSRKIKLLFQQLQEQGVEQALLDKVHAPIGLEIEADTPEEIAISIAAELIKIRRSEE